MVTNVCTLSHLVPFLFRSTVFSIADSPNCCSGSYSLPAACPPSGVAFYSFYKDNCPNAYAYAYDEGSGTALWTCDSGLRADYTLTFCP